MLRALTLVAGLLAGSAQAVEVPSGQAITLHEVLIDTVGDDTWVRFRFVAPQIARGETTLDFEVVDLDMSHLCSAFALPYLVDFDLTGDVIVISLSDRQTEFGTPNREATQIFEAYRPVDNICMWEGL